MSFVSLPKCVKLSQAKRGHGARVGWKRALGEGTLAQGASRWRCEALLVEGTHGSQDKAAFDYLVTQLRTHALTESRLSKHTFLPPGSCTRRQTASTRARKPRGQPAAAPLPTAAGRKRRAPAW